MQEKMSKLQEELKCAKMKLRQVISDANTKLDNSKRKRTEAEEMLESARTDVKKLKQDLEALNVKL